MTDETQSSELPPAPKAAKAKAAAPKRAKYRARAPKLDMSDPKIQKQIDAAIQEKLAKLMVDVRTKQADRGALDSGDEAATTKLLRGLAVAIGEVGDQGAKMKRVAPAELEARKEARDKMESLILDALVARGKAEQDLNIAEANGDPIAIEAAEEAIKRASPLYELTRPVFLDEQLVEPTYVEPGTHIRKVQSIQWPGIPDDSYRPKNAVAKAIYAQFVRSNGGKTPEAKVAYKHGYQAPDRRAPGLTVVGQEGHPRGTPETGMEGGGRMREGLKVLRAQQPGSVTDVQVLGTNAAPARQIG
jgi:hypothetical protein